MFQIQVKRKATISSLFLQGPIPCHKFIVCNEKLWFSTITVIFPLQQVPRKVHNVTTRWTLTVDDDPQSQLGFYSLVKSCFLYSCQPLHYRLRGSIGFEKYKKCTNVDACFSFNKPTKQEILHFLTWSWPKFCTKKISLHFLKTSLAKIKANV